MGDGIGADDKWLGTMRDSTGADEKWLETLKTTAAGYDAKMNEILQGLNNNCQLLVNNDNILAGRIYGLTERIEKFEIETPKIETSETPEIESRMIEVEVRTLQLLQLTENQRQEIISLRKEIDLLKGVEQK